MASRLCMLSMLLVVATATTGDEVKTEAPPMSNWKSKRPVCDPCHICECNKDNSTVKLWGETYGKPSTNLKPEFAEKWNGCKGEECKIPAICLPYEKTKDKVLIPDCRAQPSICYVGGQKALKTRPDEGEGIHVINKPGVKSFCSSDFCMHTCLSGEEAFDGKYENLKGAFGHVPYTNHGKIPAPVHVPEIPADPETGAEKVPAKQKAGGAAFQPELNAMKTMSNEVGRENSEREAVWKSKTSFDREQIYPTDKIVYESEKPPINKDPYEKPPMSKEALPQSTQNIGGGWKAVNTSDAKADDKDEDKVAGVVSLAAGNAQSDKHEHFAKKDDAVQGTMDKVFVKLEEQLKDAQAKNAQKMKEFDESQAKIQAEFKAKASSGLKEQKLA